MLGAGCEQSTGFQGVTSVSSMEDVKKEEGKKETEQKTWPKYVPSYAYSSEWHVVYIPHPQEKNLAQLSGKLIKYLGTQTLQCNHVCIQTTAF